ncbi:MAG: nitroreductase family protein [Deltaproteobacteria bacterium]|nr:nitroreductase family protein [Deltaproteobacteria bacterium]
MDALECILSRRSVRKYTPDPVSEEDLARILEAVRFAPSWANTQCVAWIRVQDPERRQALQQTLPDGNPARRAVVEAPVLLALCARKGLAGYYKDQPATVHGDWHMFDAGIAVQTLSLAAWALGYGTVNVGLLDHRAAAEILRLPGEMDLLELVPLGRPASVPRPPERKALDAIVWREVHGDKP